MRLRKVETFKGPLIPIKIRLFWPEIIRKGRVNRDERSGIHPYRSVQVIINNYSFLHKNVHCVVVACGISNESTVVVMQATIN